MESPPLFPGLSDAATALAISLQEHDDYEVLEEAMLKQRKYMTKDKKITLADRVIRANVNGCFDGVHQEVYSFIFRELQESSSCSSAKKKNWTVKYLAARLSSIFVLYKDFEKGKAVGTRRGAGHVLNSMQKEMEEVVSRAQNDKMLLESKSARTSLDYQSNGTRVQDLLTFRAE